MRESYLVPLYLRETANGNLITPATFIAYTIKGRARLYAGRYKQFLINGLMRRGCIAIPSIKGGTAYVEPKKELVQ